VTERPATPRFQHGRRPTILDVAAMCGVSKSTVSNVMRGADVVAPATRERVLAAIETLGYRPNAVARNLVQQRSNLIGVVVGNLDNPFYAELVKLMEGQASVREYTTLICNTGGHPEREAARLDALLEQRVGGLAMLEFSGDSAVLSKIVAEGVPAAMVSCWADSLDSVSVDDEAGAAMATDHLVALGHRRILHVSDAKMEASTRGKRMDGYALSLRRHGLSPGDDAAIVWDDEHPERAVRDLRRALERSPAATAVVAANDFTALRVMEALEGMGLRVPRDISLVGFDGIAVGGLSRVSLTTVAQPQRELAQEGIRILLRRMAHGSTAPIEHRRLAPELLVRGSTGPPRAAGPAKVDSRKAAE
jgi:LacI family transcriptional regulator